MNASRQHALERGLTELLGGETPPDRTLAILAAVQRARAGAGPANPRRARRWRWLGAAAGVAAATLAAVWLAPAAAEPDPPGRQPRVSVRVADGAVEWRGAVARTATAGTTFEVQPCVGDRVVAAPAARTRLWLNASGCLAMSAGTTLEIEEMKWQEFGIGFGSGTITVAVLVGSFTWLNGGTPVDAGAGERRELTLRSAQLAGGLGATPETEQLQRDLAAAQAEVERLKAERSRRPVAEPMAEPLAAEVAEVEPDAATTTPLLELTPALDDVLATIDWRDVSEQSLTLCDTLRQVMELLAAEEEIPHSLLGELERLKGTMHEYGATVLQCELLKGADFDTQVRHPLMGAQWMTAMLAHADTPLDEAQRLAITDLARRYTAEDDQRRLGYGPQTSKLQQYVDELELQERFYGDVDLMLSEGQRALFDVGALQGRVGAKLVGTASMAWGEWAKPVAVRTRAEFAEGLVTGFGNTLGLDAAQRNAMRAAAQQWANNVPDEWWDQAITVLDRRGGHHVDRLRAAAAAQMRFYERLAASGALTPEQVDRLRQVETLIVPYRRE
ncbi:MAG: hypothetical protein AAF628_25590 [Planctomycetota bacterium]